MSALLLSGSWLTHQTTYTRSTHTYNIVCLWMWS